MRLRQVVGTLIYGRKLSFQCIYSAGFVFSQILATERLATGLIVGRTFKFLSNVGGGNGARLPAGAITLTSSLAVT